jgi:hypothetical protein
VDRVRHVAARSEATFVITNNHFEGKGVANAFEIEALLTGDLIPVPETLRARYPQLAALSTAEGPGATLSPASHGAVVSGSPREPQQANFSFEPEA